MTKYLLMIAAFLSMALGISISTCSNIKEERDTYRANQEMLLGKIIFYRTKDSLSAASVQRLQLTADQLEENRAGLAKEIGSLDIKLRRVISTSVTAITTTAPLKAEVRDSLVFRDRYRVDTLKCVQYQDKWLTFAGCTFNGAFTGKIQSRDSIYTIVHRVPRRFLFFKYGTKAVRQEVKCKNPYSSVVFDEYIELIN